MKHVLLSIALFSCSMTFAQTTQPSVVLLHPDQYEQLKSNHALQPNVRYMISAQKHSPSAPARYSGPTQTLSTACNCMIPLDSTFLVVDFQSYVPPDYRNDDGSSNLITLPFSFNFFGTMYNSLYINNNGNISFGTPYSTFTANSFPDSSFVMIAPFWADVDTRAPGSGLVYYELSPTHLIVKWDSVGYYANHDDKLNTFQLIITDGTDSILPAGTNVSFCYGDMQWTTGDASAGMNGFGGMPSTTGVNMGNGTDYFQVTQNDAPGNAFDGPYGSNDGVDWLDDQEIYFNTSISGNIPPLVLNSTICDTIDVYTGDTLRSMWVDSVMFDFTFMTPEINQLVTASFSSSAPSALSYVQNVNSGNYLTYTCTFRAKDLPPGVYTVTATGTDNGSPVQQTSSTVYIHTYYDSSLGIADPAVAGNTGVYPNPAEGTVTVRSENGAQIILMNALGQNVYAASANSTQTTIDLSSFAPGIYFVQVQQKDGSVVKTKLVHQ